MHIYMCVHIYRFIQFMAKKILLILLHFLVPHHLSRKYKFPLSLEISLRI